MSDQTFVIIKSDICKSLKQSCRKTLISFSRWMVKQTFFILLRIFDQIQQENEDARDGINKSVPIICNEEGISFEQVLYILFFWCCICIY